MMVDVRAQYHSSKRTHQVTRTESHERQHQRCVLALGREERPPNCSGVIAENHEVVHLEEISQRDADDRADLLMPHFVSTSCFPIATATEMG